MGFTMASRRTILVCFSLFFQKSIVPARSFHNVAIRSEGRRFAPDVLLPLVPRRAGSDFSFTNHTARFALTLNPGGDSSGSAFSGDSRNSFLSKALSKEGIIVLSLPLILLLAYSTKLLPKVQIALGSLAILLEELLGNYKHSMTVNPLQTKVATGATLAVLGDAMAQMRESKAYDSRRAFSFAAFDSCYRVFQHFAFPFIVRVCQGRAIGAVVSALPRTVVTPQMAHLFATAERTFAYQFGVIPFFYYPVFFTFTGFIQGLTLQETFARAKNNFFPCWKRNIMFWVPIQMIMFGLIDEKWQIPFVCVMGIIWSSILSITAGKAKGNKK